MEYCVNIANIALLILGWIEWNFSLALQIEIYIIFNYNILYRGDFEKS